MFRAGEHGQRHGRLVGDVAEGDLQAHLMVLVRRLDRSADLDDQDGAPGVGARLASDPDARVEHVRVHRRADLRGHLLIGAFHGGQVDLPEALAQGVAAAGPCIQGGHGAAGASTDGRPHFLNRCFDAHESTARTSVRVDVSTPAPNPARDGSASGTGNYWTLNGCNSSVFWVMLLPATPPSWSSEKSTSRSRPDSISSNLQCILWFKS